MPQIRLHHLLWQFVEQNALEYSHKEVLKNIVQYGFVWRNQAHHKHLDWIYLDNLTGDLTHLSPYFADLRAGIANWPKRQAGDFAALEIVYEDEYCVVFHKPAGLVVEAGAGHKQDNLLSFWQAKFPQKPIYLVHRLDKDTAGLLLVAKSEKWKAFFQEQFRQRTVEKTYLAILDGSLENLLFCSHWQRRNLIDPIRQEIVWELEEIKNPEKIQKTKRAEKPEKIITLNKNEENPPIDWRFCQTDIFPLAICKTDFQAQTLVKIKIHTGRMHQIRALCAGLGLPLFGDRIYQSNNQSKNQSKNQFKKLEKLEQKTDQKPDQKLDAKNTEISRNSSSFSSRWPKTVHSLQSFRHKILPCSKYDEICQKIFTKYEKTEKTEKIIDEQSTQNQQNQQNQQKYNSFYLLSASLSFNLPSADAQNPKTPETQKKETKHTNHIKHTNPITKTRRIKLEIANFENLLGEENED